MVVYRLGYIYILSSPICRGENSDSLAFSKNLFNTACGKNVQELCLACEQGNVHTKRTSRVLYYKFINKCLCEYRSRIATLGINTQMFLRNELGFTLCILFGTNFCFVFQHPKNKLLCFI